MTSTGHIKVVLRETGAEAWVSVQHIAAVIAVEPDGPARIVFITGCGFEVCGSADYWRLKIELAILGTAEE